MLEHPSRRLEARAEPQFGHGRPAIPVPGAKRRRSIEQRQAFDLLIRFNRSSLKFLQRLPKSCARIAINSCRMSSHPCGAETSEACSTQEHSCRHWASLSDLLFHLISSLYHRDACTSYSRESFIHPFIVAGPHLGRRHCLGLIEPSYQLPLYTV